MKGILSPSDFQALAAQNGNRLFGCMSNGSGSSRTLRNNHEHRTFVIDSDDDDNNDSYKKDKETVVDKVRIGLHVVIRRAVDLEDYSSRNFNNKHYNVVFWVVPGQEFRTRIIEGVIPVWNEGGMVVIESIDDHVFLNVEVQRFNSKSDPGTSCGRVVVGRAKIPIPKELYRYRSGFISLMKNEEGENKPAGRIMVGMRLQSI